MALELNNDPCTRNIQNQTPRNDYVHIVWFRAAIDVLKKYGLCGECCYAPRYGHVKRQLQGVSGTKIGAVNLSTSAGAFIKTLLMVEDAAKRRGTAIPHKHWGNGEIQHGRTDCGPVTLV